MNKPLEKLLLVGLIVLPLCGCIKLLESDRFRSFEVPEEKLTQIETFNLEDLQVEKKPEEGEPAAAPAELALTLEEVRAITLKNNLGLKVSLLAPTIAAENVKSTEARKYEVVFTSGITHSRTDTPSLSSAETKGEGTSMNMGVSVPLRTGGSVSFNLDDIKQKSSITGVASPSSYTTPFSLSVSQPLLKGAGRREFMYSIRVAKYDQQSINAATKLGIINTIAAADQAYWDLYKKRKILEVRKQQYDLAQAQLERAKRFVDAGQNPQVDLLRAQAGLAGQLSNIIAAENDLRISQRTLKYILNKPGLPIEGATALLPKTDADPLHNVFNSQKLVTYAIDNRMEMLQLELEIAKNLSEIEHLRNATLPDLSLQYGYEVNALGASRSDSYEMLYDKNYEDHRVSLNLLFPFGNKAAKSDLRQALYLRRQKLASRADRETVIEQEVLDALDGLETSWQQILANRQSAILDGRLYEAELRQFEVGMRTSTDVLEAQAKFADSQSAEYTALANYQAALIDLAKATGTILGAAKIEWEPEVPEIGIE
ncbi:MAG: TolC family protein [Planctomycetes bacterium]|nr:TolC family protein [Planctomycetota bacterium]